MPAGAHHELRQIGAVVHPTRDVDGSLGALRHWSEEHDVAVVQVPVLGAQQEVAPVGEAGDCDLIVAIGGDGTTLAAIHGGHAANVPVLGVACGSLGALTSVPGSDVAAALERFREGEWERRELPVLLVQTGGQTLSAFNDAAVVRAGEGQVRVSVSVDGVLYARLAGDGCVLSTAIGSSAYAFAAGGPLLALHTPAFLITPLSNHGGSCPPLVVSASSRVALEVIPSFGGVRLEVDGKTVEADPRLLQAELSPGAATLVAFRGEEPALTGLRRRGLIIDSPRILAEDARAAGRLR